MKQEEPLRLPDLLAQTREVSALFDHLVGPWTPAVMLSELAAEVGALADSMMIAEGHRPPRSDAPALDLEDDVADVLFMLLRLAEHYYIDLHESYARMLASTRERLQQQLAEREDASLVLIKPFNKEAFAPVTAPGMEAHPFVREVVKEREEEP